MAEKKRSRGMRNDRRKMATVLETRAGMVRAAFADGAMSKREIRKKTGLTVMELSNLFTADRTLYGEYLTRLRTITSQAADNLYEIVADKNHPKNWEASKYALTHYKSELEEILTPMAAEMTIDMPTDGQDGIARPRITFSSRKEKD